MPVTPKSDLSKWNGSEAAMKMMQEQSEQLLSANRRMMSMYSEFMAHWLERRQQAASSAIELARKATEANGDGRPVNLPHLMNEWVEGSFRRVTADIEECQECGRQVAALVQDSLPQWSAPAATATTEKRRSAGSSN